ncbi:L,D-transpeptidase family protein [Marivirga salinae]|uniref:L,D-transpeptidase family protein n=1 Tax=Marivirga salinarum TaxID=3059078 RepID=A0AA51N9F3_9BACT|nr:L,D-transpeptidase family protein [Marivirga sp. BDSF4-3]WMN11127.1 L,D-transpeptidase family protein [Marivirga sp. BDSF4-3]
MRSTLIFFFFIFLLSSQVQAQNEASEELTNHLRISIESLAANTYKINDATEIQCRSGIPEFYNLNGLNKIWNKEATSQLIEAVKSSFDEGLNPQDYHIDELIKYSALQEPSLIQQVEKEILFTDAYLLLASHLMSGKVDPVKIDAAWKVIKREGNPVNILIEASQKNNIEESLRSLKPNFKAYDRLKAQLKVYRELKGENNWELLPMGETLKKGNSDVRITEIRNRLFLFKDLKILRTDSTDFFDSNLESAVISFQKRHGLTADGAIGKETLAMMNLSPEDRINQIIINLDRCRWLPKELGSKYIMVNLPAYELELVVDSKVEFEMKVAVGKPFRQSPVFSSKMTYMVFNPYWTVPPTILYQDMIPAQAKNANHLKNLNIKVLNSQGAELDPAAIDWKSFKGSGFPYTLRQEPGKNNALGQVKFIYPNPYNVYMHDTNHKELFRQPDRALSSGCIRLSEPLVLAKYLLETDKNWKEEKMMEILKTSQNYTVILSQPYQVHLQYWTAFVDEQGTMNFRKDIYNRDTKVLKALLEN